MPKSSSAYRHDLPEDLLELIDHTTKGVQRLYESTKRASRAVSRNQRQAPTTLPSYSSCSECTSEAEHAATQLRNGRGTSVPRQKSSSSRAKERKASAPAVKSIRDEGTELTYDDGLPLHPHPLSCVGHEKNGKGRRRSTDSGDRVTARQQQWGYSQPLPTSGADMGGPSHMRMGSTTFSSDNPTHHPVFNRSASRQQMSTSSAFSSSAAFEQDHSSSLARKSWKDTFRSLLTGDAAPPSFSNEAAIETISSRSPTPFTQGANAVPDKAPSHCGSRVALEDADRHSRKPRSPLQEPEEEDIEHLRHRLREQEVSHKEELAQLRTKHCMEVTRLRRAALEARQKILDEVTAQLQSSADVKVKLLRAEIESERQRADGVQKMLEEDKAVIERLRGELDVANNNVKTLRKDLSTKTKTIAKLNDNLEGTQRELAECREEVGKHSRNLAESTRREKVAISREKEQRNAVRQLEEQLNERERRSREELARLQEELRTMSDGYEKLIKEASEKLSVLEKVERKYHALKEQHRDEKKQSEVVTSETAVLKGEKEELERKVEELQDELEAFRLQVARKEHELREERVGHSQMVDEIVQKMEQQQEKSAREQEDLQKALRNSEERLARSQRATEGLERQLQEEQAHSKELLLKLEEGTLRHKEELAATRRSAATYHQQSEGVISSLKRQLREKDTKLEALANAASEPLHRLRSQLEDERSKRARLEEQFNQYKQKAKFAQEAALREIRREQQRVSSVGRTQPKSGLMPRPRLSGHEEGDLMFPTPPSASSASPAGTIAVADVSPMPTPTYPPPLRDTDVAGGSSRTPVKVANSVSHAPQMHDRHNEGNTVTPPQYVGHRSGWDSVGSISNISCSSPLCSSRFGDLRSVDESVVSAGDGRPAAHALANGNGMSPAGQTIDERMVQHELVLQEFHKSAAEVFRKITGNRDEFLARCTSAVRSASHRTADKEHISVHGNGVLD